MPAVNTRRSQPGSVVDMLAEPVLFAVGLEPPPDDMAVGPVAVAVTVGVLDISIDDPVMIAPFRIVEVVWQEEELGLG